MQPLTKRALSTVAATAAFTVAAIAQSEAAHAFLITRSAGPLPPAGVNPSLAAPTVIDFEDLTGNVSATEEAIGPGATGDGLNGGATIQRTFGSADYVFLTDDLRIGLGAAGQVSFRFDDPRGMGYFGFLLEFLSAPASAVSVSFLSQGSLIQTLTGTQIGSEAVGTGNYFNFFVTNNDEIFDQVLFTDSSNRLLGGSILIDNVAYQAIPTPALLPGLLGLAIGAVRKRRAESAS